MTRRDGLRFVEAGESVAWRCEAEANGGRTVRWSSIHAESSVSSSHPTRHTVGGAAGSSCRSSSVRSSTYSYPTAGCAAFSAAECSADSRVARMRRSSSASSSSSLWAMRGSDSAGSSLASSSSQASSSPQPRHSTVSQHNPLQKLCARAAASEFPSRRFSDTRVAARMRDRTAASCASCSSQQEPNIARLWRWRWPGGDERRDERAATRRGRSQNPRGGRFGDTERTLALGWLSVCSVGGLLPSATLLTWPKLPIMSSLKVLVACLAAVSAAKKGPKVTNKVPPMPMHRTGLGACSHHWRLTHRSSSTSPSAARLLAASSWGAHAATTCARAPAR
eukprot:scaffold104937_cov75-Phaeocystis_antarctica.AAC.4